MAMTSRADSPSRLDDVLADFEDAWRSGLSPRAEDWLGRLEGGSPVEASELIYQEFLLAESDGAGPDPESYLGRFPSFREPLSRLFELHALTSAGNYPAGALGAVGLAALPREGDEIGTFSLVRLLGQGAFARVFLAEQADLGGRTVVLKVTTRPSPEAKLLARARHAHIVEVIRQIEAETDDGTIYLVCMPFLGGATLGDVNAEGEGRPRSGRDLLGRLDAASAPEYPPADVPRPAREIVLKLSYPKAIAYLFARLAEALDHAYRRGVTHGDLKPTNILLTADGLPMLFDFNLAVDWDDPGGATEGGGTLAYMPPERLRAIATARPGSAGASAPTIADLHRADLYALSLVLVESLTRVAPAVPAPAPTGGIRGQAAAIADSRAGGTAAFPGWSALPIPAGLRPILAHCLEADPADRYRDGRALAADLDRWRKDLPPLAAPDAPRPARLARWARRRRLPLAAAILTCLGAVVASAGMGARYRSSRRDLAEAKYARFVDKDGLGLFGNRTPGSFAPKPIDPAEDATRKLNQYGVVDDPDWRRRDDVRSLDPPHRDDLELLMLEQVYRLADALSARLDSPDDWRRGLARLDREYALVPARALEAKRLALRRQLGLGDPADPAPASTVPAWVESYLLGVAAERLEARVAFAHYEETIAARPGLLWPRYRAAAAAVRLAKYTDSTRQLQAAAALRPENPALQTLLANSLLRLTPSRTDEALAASERALAIDPDYAEAYASRAFIDRRRQRPAEQQKDLDRFSILTRFRGRASAEKLRFSSQLDSLFGRAAPSADATARLLRDFRSSDAADPDLRYVEAVRIDQSGKPEEALGLLEEIVREYPDHVSARCRRAILLHKLGKPGSLEVLTAELLDPRFEENFRTNPQAILEFPRVTNEYLGRGQFEVARSVAERGLELSVRNGGLEEATLCYSLARVEAAASAADPGRLKVATRLLRRAFELRPEAISTEYSSDPLFEAIRRSEPTFFRPTARIDPLARSGRN